MRNKLFLVFLILTVILGSCSHDDPLTELESDNPEETPENPDTSSETFYFPPVTGDSWQTVSPDSLQWNADSLQHLLEFVKGKNTHAFIILHKGKIVTENYWDGWDASTKSSIASAGKSITAFLFGIAQQENLLRINQRTSEYLGQGWSSLSSKKEDLITIYHHLSMTTGLLDSDDNCTAPSCLHYKADAGKRWAYHNVAYFLLHPILEKASGISMDEYTKTRLADKIGLQNWSWENYMLSLNTRDMARFGLLVLAKGTWGQEKIMTDSSYFKAMTETSNNYNKSYGYLWWLNGKPSYMVPEQASVHQGSLTPAAPPDMISAMGRGDKKIYVVPSLNLVVVRHGEDAGEPTFGPSSFDNDLWKKLKGVFAGAETAM
jgi:CubicO group peptidase (beta-lactamase class C family)